MKFGRRLDGGLKAAAWSKSYLRYNEYKTLIKTISREDFDAAHAQELITTLAIGIQKDTTKIDELVEGQLDTMERLAYDQSDNCLHRLLQGHLKGSNFDVEDPNITSNREAEQLLRSLVVLQDRLESLEDFVAVNAAALRKIQKKIHRRLVKGKATDGRSVSDDSSLMSISNLSLDSAQGQVQQRMSNLCRHLRKIEQDVLVSSLGYAEYIMELRIQLLTSRHQRQVDQHRMEAFKAAATPLHYIASWMDLRSTIRPTAILLLNIFLPIIVALLCYPISASVTLEGTNETIFDQQGYFISSAITVPPASHIGTFGLSLTCVCIFIVAVVRHRIRERQLLGRGTIVSQLSFTTIIISTISGLGVASFQLHLSVIPHDVFAMTFFMLGAAHVMMETWMDWFYTLETQRLRRIRLAIALNCVCSVAVMLTFMFLGQSSPEDPESYDMKKLFVSAVAEFFAFGSFLAYFSTYLPSFAHTRIHAVLIQREARLMPDQRLSISAELEDLAACKLTSPQRKQHRLDSALDHYIDKAVSGVLTEPIIAEESQ